MSQTPLWRTLVFWVWFSSFVLVGFVVGPHLGAKGNGLEVLAWLGHSWPRLFSVAYYFLWWLSLFLVFNFLAEFVRSPDPFIRASRGTLIGGVLILLIWWVVATWFGESLAVLKGNVIVQKALIPGFQLIVLKTFPFVVGLALVSHLLGVLGFRRHDPIKEAMQEKVHWPAKVDHKRFEQAALKDDATYLGFEVVHRQPVFIDGETRSKHLQILGSTGSGKTRSALFPLMFQDIQEGRGVLFIDAKGSSENAKMVFEMVRRAGREKDFRYFSLTDVDHAASYNPLQHGNSSQLKDKIAGSIDWSEPFYQRTCENALQTMFMELEARNRRVTLGELYGLLKEPPLDLPQFRETAGRNRKNIETLFSEMGLLVNTPFGKLFEVKSGAIDLLDVYQNGKVAYFALDTQSYQQTAMRVGKMITQDINTLSGLIETKFSGREKKELAVYIDEFQAFGTKGFINALARGRSSGLWITIAHQSLGDLKAIDDAYSQQVIENTNTKIFLRVNDPETAQLFSDTVGTAKAVSTTKQIHLEGEDPKNIMGSQHVAQEYLIHPSEVKNLEPGQAVFKSGRMFGRLKLNGLFWDTDGIELPKSMKTNDHGGNSLGPDAPPTDIVLL